MIAKVVDASVFAALSFQEAGADRMRKSLSGFELHAPRLLRFEMANVCLKKIRLYPDRRAELAEMHARSLAVVILEHAVDQVQILDIAQTLRLSAYDASYLWLACALGCELVTLDEKLAKAFIKMERQQ
ncbi:MAG: type II toxin-antitoxin system VapC family toxin [Proteobacteria bacterium]|nr:type II toxin-antitoxin system VapC family toxin [Pseudomonadota bacterium]